MGDGYQKICDLIDKLQHIISISIDSNTEKALAAISSCAEIMYTINQTYKSDYLESYLKTISDKLSIEISDRNNDTVVFYDSFGLDTRGVALVYVKALLLAGYRVVYITGYDSKNKQLKMHLELDNMDIEWRYIDLYTSYSKWINELSTAIQEIAPKAAFLYTTPWDVSGIVVFNALKSKIKRIMLDLTDHAFWLGINAFDICVGGRDFSASIQHYERGISKDKLVKLDANLYIDRNQKLLELPFNINNIKFIFSGGSLYKTLGDNNLYYYQIIESILESHKDIYFLYAGSGDSTQMAILQKKYLGRVYLVPERPDFYQIMEKCIFFLNTYPMFGGLMMRYAASANKLPITLKHDNDADGILFNQEKLGIEYKDMPSLLADVDLILSNEEYRLEKERKLKNSVLTEKRFSRNIKSLVEIGNTEFKYYYNRIDTTRFREEYLRRLDYITVATNCIAKRINNKLFTDFYQLFFMKIIILLRRRLLG